MSGLVNLTFSKKRFVVENGKIVDNASCLDKEYEDLDSICEVMNSLYETGRKYREDRKRASNSIRQLHKNYGLRWLHIHSWLREIKDISNDGFNSLDEDDGMECYVGDAVRSILNEMWSEIRSEWEEEEFL